MTHTEWLTARATDAGAIATRPRPVASLLRDPARSEPTLTDVFDELRALRRAISVLMMRSTPGVRMLSPADAARLGSLLPAIHRALPGGLWTVGELAALSLIPEERYLPPQAALAEHCRAGRSLKSFGWFLRRCAGHDACGLRLDAIGADRGGALWSVVPV